MRGGEDERLDRDVGGEVGGGGANMVTNTGSMGRISWSVLV